MLHRNTVSFGVLFFLILTISFATQAGKIYGHEPAPRQPIDDPATVDYPDIQSLLDAREALWRRKLSRQERHEIVLAMYEGAVDLLHTPDAYILLLECNDNYHQATVQFIKNNSDRFFSLKPNISEVVRLGDCAFDVATQIYLREKALPMVTTPEGFLELITSDLKFTHHDYNIGLTDFIESKLDFFKTLNPTLQDVIDLQNKILEYKTCNTKTRTLILKLKHLFIDSFQGKELAKLLGRWKNMLESDKTKLDELIIANLDVILPRMKAMKNICSLNKNISGIANAMELKKRSLPLLKTPQDFLVLITPCAAKPIDAEYLSLITDFVTDNLAIYQNMQPKVEDVKRLQIQIDSNDFSDKLNFIVLTQFFDKFHGDDLLTLLETTERIQYSLDDSIDTLIKKNLPSIVPTLDKINYFLRLEKIASKTSLKLKIKKSALSLVTKPHHFLRLVRNGKYHKQEEANELVIFISDNLATFRKTDPTIHDIIKLKNFVLHTKASFTHSSIVILKIMETFKPSFSGSDLDSLLSPGTTVKKSTAWETYVKGIESLRGSCVDNWTAEK